MTTMAKKPAAKARSVKAHDITDDYVEGDHPTKNPDGVTVSNHDYTPKTQEEKAGMVRVPFADPIEGNPEEPYPTGDSWVEQYDENFYQAHGYRREGKGEPPENEPEPVPEPVKIEV